MVGHTGSVYQEASVPASAGTWTDSETLYLRRSRAPEKNTIGNILELVLYVDQLPTSAVLHVDILKEGHGDLDSDSSWQLSVATYDTEDTLSSPLVLYAAGVRIRSVSGGTSGTAIFLANFLY